MMMVLGTGMGTIICGDGWGGNDCCGNGPKMGTMLKIVVGMG